MPSRKIVAIRPSRQAVGRGISLGERITATAEATRKAVITLFRSSSRPSLFAGQGVNSPPAGPTRHSILGPRCRRFQHPCRENKYRTNKRAVVRKPLN